MNWIKKLALLLALVLLLGLLGGCNLSELTTLGGLSGKKSTMLDGTVNCYAEPSLAAKVVATFNGGLLVEYSETVEADGVQWVQSEYGWVVLGGEPKRDENINIVETVAPTVPATTESIVLREGFITARLLNVRSGPGVDYEQVAQMPKGTRVYVGKTAQASDGPWGETDEGWISLDHVYYPGEVGENTGYAVVREQGAKVYNAILGTRSKLDTLQAGERVEVLEWLEMENGTLWIYAAGGWISGDDVYVEGMEGNRPCDGIVNDTTPLNVRVGPGTDFSKVYALPNGTYVEVLEQITRKKNDWGYVEIDGYCGWIFMNNVNTDFRNATEPTETESGEQLETTTAWQQ